MKKDIIYKIENLAAGYGDKKVIEDINLELIKGKSMGIVGESGSGKSTLANAMTYFSQIFGGRMIYKGEDITHLSKAAKRNLRRKIQMIIQDSNSSFPPKMTVSRYIEEPLINFYKMTSLQRKRRVRELLEMVGLDSSYLKRYPFELSGGQRQRVAITRALAAEPDILICDEITSALDVSVQRQITDLLKKLQKERQITFLFICHDLALMTEICDELAIMYQGNIVERLPAGGIRNAEHFHTKELLEATFKI